MGTLVGSILRQLEGHLDALLARLAEVEDAADAGLEARLADRVDRAQPRLVADRRRDLVVVGLGRLDVVVHALDAGLAQRLGARCALMCPIDAQRLRFVCSATRRAPSSTFSKSRLDSPWPWVTMQKRCAPAASAARACSSICSGSIIACIGVSASANRDCAQNPQSSAHPPDLALTSEHMSVLSPKRSWRACQARSTSASMSAWSSSSPRRSASLARDERRHGAETLGRAARTAPLPSTPVAPIRVLVCDDVEAFRALLRYTLQEDADIEVVGEAADGIAGIRAAERLQPDVVLLDLTMPLLDGMEAIPADARARAGRADRRPERVGGRAHGAGALDSGAVAYVQKSDDVEAIRDAVRAAAVA